MVGRLSSSGARAFALRICCAGAGTDASCSATRYLGSNVVRALPSGLGTNPENLRHGRCQSAKYLHSHCGADERFSRSQSHRINP